MNKTRKQALSTYKNEVSRKMAINFKEAKAAKLHSGSKHGPIVTNPKQIEAISYSQARKGK